MGDFSKEINSTFPNERVKALLNIKYTANHLDTIGNNFLKPFNISEQQYNILRILRGAKEAITVNAVKDRMVQKSPNSTRLMDKLCNKNLNDVEFLTENEKFLKAHTYFTTTSQKLRNQNKNIVLNRIQQQLKIK
mgnify:CR=1 FL=1